MRLIEYIKGSYEELSVNMTWISKEEAQKSTMMVAAFTIIFAVVVALIDKVFSYGLTEFFNLV